RYVFRKLSWRSASGRFEPANRRPSNGRNRRSAEARDSIEGLPLTVRERSFVLRPLDGEVCPKAATRPGDGFRAKAWQSTDMAQVRVSLVFESGARMR